MKAKRKLVTMIVTVSVPAGVTVAVARRIIRQRVGYFHIGGEPAGIKSVQPAAAVLRDAAMARTAWGKIKHPKPRKRDGTPPLLEAMGEK